MSSSINYRSPCFSSYQTFSTLIHGRASAKAVKKISSSRSSNFYVQAVGKCKKCNGQGAIECPGCKGTGKNKKNGNMFERWKCYECQGFGLKSCPTCGKGGLTPEQRGER
ncbi:hypothetical protein QJS04_geneDACA009995 [Acorus gramineus]|uniref:Uncharacterized protein n=1 Tax=Acorus gramineus TaxID=55184 RepID=A0AAV9BHJ1_ACOGR|nr:hypothetical protein QJS04_geneDACA009995 [Acorus gramineus]